MMERKVTTSTTHHENVEINYVNEFATREKVGGTKRWALSLLTLRPGFLHRVITLFIVHFLLEKNYILLHQMPKYPQKLHYYF